MDTERGAASSQGAASSAPTVVNCGDAARDSNWAGLDRIRQRTTQEPVGALLAAPRLAIPIRLMRPGLLAPDACCFGYAAVS
ncbi:hypothetical protein [Nitrolancea hollandica]|uniref:Uncharacterized protein n=1 Tax=Nitrolancea hollandica Lb TaxID=1129897 RepID=I4EFG4_9BACT|nr:hypothetical protein [Nitrolancea hollandica]CCF83426.1 hypothetical protein NITHO_2290004 [Nitrolancea hollandica Lb]